MVSNYFNVSRHITEKRLVTTTDHTVHTSPYHLKWYKNKYIVYGNHFSVENSKQHTERKMNEIMKCTILDEKNLIHKFGRNF